MVENNILQIKDLSFSYGNLTVLKDINLEIKKGEIFGLIGPNGSGKSTLLKIILGLLPVQTGEVMLFEKPLHKFRDWSKIGYVSQKANSFNSGFPATVFEVVSMGLLGKKGVFRRSTSKDKEKVKETIALVGLEDLESRNIGKLSGGQQQRTFIARALVSQPELLILDEPTVGVDIEAIKHFYHLLKQLNKQFGITIILVSHDIGVVTKQVTQLGCLNKRLYFHGNPDEFTESSDILNWTYGKEMGLVNHHHHGEE